MKTDGFKAVLLGIMCLALLFSSTYGNTYNVFYSQAFSLSAETPKVILKSGTSGESIIYMNDTSARVKVSSLVHLEYGYAFKSSSFRVSTTSGTPVDDTEAILNITLDKDSVVFILYNVGNKHNSVEPRQGKGITINIDGADIETRQWQSPFSMNYANSVTIAYLGYLSAGQHTIKGRFFSNQAGSTTTIDERQLVVLCFPASLIIYGFVQSTTSVYTYSGTPN